MSIIHKFNNSLERFPRLSKKIHKFNKKLFRTNKNLLKKVPKGTMAHFKYEILKFNFLKKIFPMD